MADDEMREDSSEETTEAEKNEQRGTEENEGKLSSRPQTPRSEKSSRASSSSSKPGSRPLTGGSQRPLTGGSQHPFPTNLDRPPSTALSESAQHPTSASHPASASRPSSVSASSRPVSASRLTPGRPVSGTGFTQHRSRSQSSESSGKMDADQMPLDEENTMHADESTFQDALKEFPLHHDESANMTALVATQSAGGGDGDNDGGDDGDDTDEENEEEEDREDENEDSDEGSDNETEMVVMDPDHPLMKRFQAALKSHLVKQNDRLTLEFREMDKTLNTRKKEREDLGVDLYGVQQELARYQMLLEHNHDNYAQKHQQREHHEQELVDIRALYKDTQLTVNKEKKKGAELQSEVENLALRLFYMENAKEDVRSDIAVMRRAAEKVESEVAHAEFEKQRQDLYVDRLMEQVDKLKEEMAMYEAQITAQSEETRAAKDALMEAHMEMEITIGLEKKQLFQQWNSSLIGMRRRDEAHFAMQEALHQQEQKILSLETEMEGLKKSIQKEQEQNEKLTLILAKTERDIESIKKQLAHCQARFDALKAEFTTYTRMLHETEQALNRATADKVLRESELSSLRKQIEHEFQEKVSLEDQIMERLREQLTLDKAAQYSKKLTSKTRELSKKLETQMAEDENKIARDTLENVNVRARIERLDQMRIKADVEIVQKNEVINHSQNEIGKRNAIIERKQNAIDQYNKKLEQMITAAGGIELGPLEIQINSVLKSMDSRQQEIDELQQLWLRQQSELVRLAQEKDTQCSDVEKHKHQLTILTQKKIRIENEIDQQGREIYDTTRNIRNMQNDVIKLNTLLFNQNKTETSLEKNNILTENEFIWGLKEAELESIKLAQQLDEVKEEKERLLNSLVEAERQIMLWEKKTQLARETRAAVDSDFGQGEIKAMKAEIHRMTVRYSQLMKMQEKMISDMEKSVSRRDTIVTRGEAQSKLQKKVITKGAFERQMVELRKKIKSTIQDASDCDSEIRQLREHQVELSKLLEEKQVNCQTLQGSADTFDGDVEELLQLKQKNMIDLLTRQQRLKYYQQVKEGRYTMQCRSESALDVENSKQEGRIHALSTILDRLNQEFPHAQLALRRAALMLSTLLLSGEVKEAT